MSSAINVGCNAGPLNPASTLEMTLVGKEQTVSCAQTRVCRYVIAVAWEYRQKTGARDFSVYG